MQIKRFSKEFEIHYYEVNKLQEATPITILNYLEDSAISNSASVGYGVNELKEIDAGWVLNRWYLKMDRYPKLGEKIIIETWPSSFERFYGNREFLIMDVEGKIIGRAASIWIYFNIAKRRPMRIPVELGNAYGGEQSKALSEPFTYLDFDFAPDAVEEFQVKRSDIDTNDHVNNKKYIDWIMESVPQEIYDNYKVVSLEIMYKKESTLGAVIQSGCISDPECSGCPCLMHRIWDKNTGLELAAAKTIWQKI